MGICRSVNQSYLFRANEKRDYLLELHKVFLQISILQMRVLFEYKNEFAENITDTSKLTRQNLGNLYKQKILTAHIQAVRIMYGAPDRHNVM